MLFRVVYRFSDFLFQLRWKHTGRSSVDAETTLRPRPGQILQPRVSGRTERGTGGMTDVATADTFGILSVRGNISKRIRGISEKSPKINRRHSHSAPFGTTSGQRHFLDFIRPNLPSSTSARSHSRSAPLDRVSPAHFPPFHLAHFLPFHPTHFLPLIPLILPLLQSMPGSSFFFSHSQLSLCLSLPLSASAFPSLLDHTISDLVNAANHL